MTQWRVHIIYLSFLTFSVAGHLLSYKQSEKNVSREPASLEVDPKMIGNLEQVHFGENKDLQFYAKIDTGAQSSSIHAQNIKTFSKTVNGKATLFVEFETIDENYNSRIFTRPVAKIGEVKSALGVSKRYYIREKIWIGDAFHYVNVNLADRSHLKRKFLVGKNILDEGYLINTALRTP